MHILSVYVMHVFIVSFTPKTAVLFPNDNVTFICNETNFRVWIINETDNFIPNDQLVNIAGVSSDNGTMLIITQSLNNTLYGCAILQSDGGFIIDTGILYLASMYCIHVYMHINVRMCVCMYGRVQKKLT